MSEIDVGILIGKVEILTDTIKTLDEHNSKQHSSMFEYINQLQEKTRGLEVEQVGIQVFNAGVSENLNLIITDIRTLKTDVSDDIKELRNAMLIQLQQGFFDKFSKFCKESIVPFAKTKAGMLILTFIALIIGYISLRYFIGLNEILALVSKFTTR